MDSNDVLKDLQNSAVNMTGWLKFVGIVTIVSGALAALSVVGIIFAWIPIWLGILLMQAAARAENARISDNPQESRPDVRQTSSLLFNKRGNDHSWSGFCPSGFTLPRYASTVPDGKCGQICHVILF